MDQKQTKRKQEKIRSELDYGRSRVWTPVLKFKGTFFGNRHLPAPKTFQVTTSQISDFLTKREVISCGKKENTKMVCYKQFFNVHPKFGARPVDQNVALLYHCFLQKSPLLAKLNRNRKTVEILLN